MVKKKPLYNMVNDDITMRPANETGLYELITHSDIDMALELLNKKRNEGVQEILKYINSLKEVKKVSFKNYICDDYNQDYEYDYEGYDYVFIIQTNFEFNDNVEKFVEFMDIILDKVFEEFCENKEILGYIINKAYLHFLKPWDEK